MKLTANGGLFCHVGIRKCNPHANWLPAQMMRVMKPTHGRFHRSIMKKLLITMKLLTFFLFTACLSAAASGTGQSVTVAGKDLTYKQLFSAIKEQTGYVVLYDPELLVNKTSSVAVKQLELRAFLDMVLEGELVEYDIQGTTVFIARKLGVRKDGLLLDQPPVRVQVTDADGNPLAGATVINKKTKHTTITDENGWSNIEATIGDVIQVTYVGFSAQTFTIREISKVINIQLKANNVLEEAVVNVGYQTIKQKYLTGAVTSLKMDSIMQPGLSTIDKMLEGRVPGMMFMQNSGQSGAAPKLRIRGTNTYLGSREPLWVVDGIIRTNPLPIPADRLNDPDFVNLVGNAISGLNPFDIEQIDVLKDATAAALYGVRGANGVIVITTKRGKPGPPTINYNVTTSITQRPRYSDRSVYLMNSKERVDVSREMFEKGIVFRSTNFEAYERALIDYNSGNINYETLQHQVAQAESANMDWLKTTMRDVVANNHSISVSGGSLAASYRASIGYRANPGVIKKEANDLFTGSLNLQLNHKKLKADVTVGLNKGVRRYTPSDVGLMNYAFNTSRTIPLLNEDGSPYFYATTRAQNSTSTDGEFETMNILNEIQNSGDKIQTTEQNVSINLNYELLPGLQFRSTLSYAGGDALRTIYFTENTNYIWLARGIYATPSSGIYYPEMDMIPFGGELREESNRRQNYLISPRLNFSKMIDKRDFHQLSFEVAGDILSNRNSGKSETERGYLIDRGHSFANIDLLKYTKYRAWLQANRPLITEDVLNSFRPFLTGTYIYKDKYVITSSTSQEFSNAFGNRSNEKFLPTWAVSGRWNIKEDILMHWKWVNRLALIASMGSRGNMIEGQNPQTIITKGPFDTYYNENSSTIKSFPNPELTWEMVKDYNAQLEFTVFNGRMNGSLGYYFSRTTNAFLTKKVSNMNGVTSYTVNAGTLENQGLELAFNFKIIDNYGSGKKKGFLWRFDPQLGQAINKLIGNNLNSRNVIADLSTLNYGNYLNGSVPVNGKSVNTFYSYRFKGLDPNFGFPIFYGAEPAEKIELVKKYNALSKEEVYAEVFVESGKREPVLQGSINNSFVYRDFSLNISFSYSVGNHIRLLRIASGNYGTYRPSSQQNLRKEFVNRWQYPGDEFFTNIPSLQGIETITDYEKYGWFLDPSANISTKFSEDYYQMYDNADIRTVRGDYLKLQYFSFSYRFNESILNRLHCKGGFISLSGNNLFTLANRALRGQDPTQSGAAPTLNLSIRPVYALNLNISF